jgi:hypothetical protein
MLWAMRRGEAPHVDPVLEALGPDNDLDGETAINEARARDEWPKELW